MKQKNSPKVKAFISPTFELGQLYFEKGEMTIAEDKFHQAEKEFLEAKKFDDYLKCAQKILRIYAEREDYKAIDLYKDRLQSLAIKEKIDLDSKTYYVLALCAFFKGDSQVALEYVEKALALALAADNKEDICYAIHGISIVYTSLGRLDDALKEIYNLRIFFQVIDNAELQIQSDIVSAHILRKMQKFDQAFDVLWACYERLKSQKNFLLHLELLYAMGLTYTESGQLDVAKIYLGLANQSIDPENLKHLKRSIDEVMKRIGQVDESEYDLVFDSSNKTLLEKNRGRVDFHNQFILLDLLKLFLKKPGEVHSKEEIVEKVWKQNYDPSVHDNKLYVTIKRLRKMIEPDYEKPKYIFRAKNGYYLNKNIKVLMQNR